MAFNLEDLASSLQQTTVSETGVSFAGKSLKLDKESDVKPVIEEIEKCSKLEYLNLEGNTLGVDASESIGKALAKHPEFKRALWKDMFTGRMKTEIPKALEHLGHGLVSAGSRLTELDLSDNAFGPIGVQGLASLIKSSSFHALEILRLNNNGLGITGGKLLAEALTNCYNFSKSEGKPLALKVFIAGRNRLENDGARALAEVFKMMGTLEEVAMPQNGIYFLGITALSEAFTHNKNLSILNLNDNTIGPKGSVELAKALITLKKLKQLNLGDCLLKTTGALALAKALSEKHNELEEVIMGFNEIRKNGGLAVAKALSNKPKMKSLVLDGNQFGQDGRDEILEVFKSIGKSNIIEDFEEDESEDSEEEDEDSDSVASSANESDEEEQDQNETNLTTVNVQDFIQNPTAENFLALGEARKTLLVNEAKKNGQIILINFIPLLMKVSGLYKNTKENVRKASLDCSEALYKELFTWGLTKNCIPFINNELMVNLNLLKNEENKKFKPSWDTQACLLLLDTLKTKNYIPVSTKTTLDEFKKLREIK